MKVLYRSIDGVLFDSEEACLKHENITDCLNDLKALIESRIPYNDDAGFECFDPDECVEFIRNNFVEIKEIFEKIENIS